MRSGRRQERKRQRTQVADAADLNMMAQKYFKQQGSGEQQSWDLAFANGYTNGFESTHHRE